jgi:hypothetical protein
MTEKQKLTNCLNCFYCAKAHRSPDDDGKEKLFVLENQERDKLKSANYDFLKELPTIIWYLTCYRKVWCEVIDGINREKLRGSLSKKKCKNYFSFKKSEFLTFPAAVELQKNKDENFKFWFTNILVIIGILITMVFGVLSLLIK